MRLLMQTRLARMMPSQLVLQQVKAVTPFHQPQSIDEAAP
jgi:hypothetical protein